MSTEIDILRASAVPAILDAAGAQTGVLTPAMFGAVGDGVADDAAALQAMFDASLASGRPWRITGQHNIGDASLTCHTGGDGSGGKIITTAEGQTSPAMHVLPAPGDERTADSDLASAFNALLPLPKGTQRIPALGAWAGQSVRIYSAAKYIQRLTGSGDYRHEIFFEVTDSDGNIWPPLPFDVPDDLSPALQAEVQPLRDWIDVHLPEMRVVSGDTERAALARIERCRVNVRGGSVFNETATPLRIGVSIHYVTSVRCWGLHVDGLRRNSTNYGFGVTGALVEMHGCSENHCRRGFESTYGMDMKLIGGNYPDAIGGHLLFGLQAIGATIGGAGSNVRPIFASGADVEVIGCKVYVGSVGVVMDMRSDTPDLTGTVRLANCEVVLDLPDNAGDFDAALLRMSFPSTSYDPLRTLHLPESIHITDNRIRVLGTDHSARLHLFRLSDNYGGVQNQDVVVDSRLIARGNTFDFANGAPEVRVLWNKRANWIGRGIDLHIEDVPDLLMDIGAVADAETAVARANVTTRNCDVVNLRCDGGSVHRAEILGRTTAAISAARGVTDLIGDEDWRAISGALGVSDYSPAYTGRDWDTERPSGFIGSSSGSAAAVPANSPSGNFVYAGWGARVSTTRASQMLMRVSTSPSAWFRVEDGSAGWSDWLRFMHNGIALPTTEPGTPSTFWRDAANGNVVKLTPPA